MAASTRFRDSIRAYIPVWLSDRLKKNVGFRFLWAVVATHDALADVTVEGVQAAWPGQGTPSALALIGRTRGLVRWQDEASDSYAMRLRGWLETWARARTREMALQLHGYLRSKPKVRVITRGGEWITVGTDGTVTEQDASWDWDSLSHPERASWWSDLWIVIYTSQYLVRPGTMGALPAIDDGYGLGQMVPRTDFDAIATMLGELKGAHSRIRAIIWCSDPTLFDPAVPATCPDGTWGGWGYGTPSTCTRDLTSCRYWEI